MSFDWTPERDAELRRLRNMGRRNSDIAEAMGTTLAIVYARVVALQLPRLPVSGGTRVKRGFWTAERDAKLREMWVALPQPTLRAVRVAFDFAVSEAAISSRAVNVLGLPRRHRHAGREARLARVRSTFAGECPREAAATPKPRVVIAAEFEPCPYIDPHAAPNPDTGKIERCGVVVDRRTRRDGAKPSQYCKAHEARVRTMGAPSYAGTRFVAARGGPVW